MSPLSAEAEQRLETEQNLWVATVQEDGSPHLVPVWYAWVSGKLYICIEAQSVKGRNLAHNDQIMAALEGGMHPVICQGRAAPYPRPWPEAVVAQFLHKYEWNIAQDSQYDQLIEITPKKWLAW